MLEREPWTEHRAGSRRGLGANVGPRCNCEPWAFHHWVCGFGSVLSPPLGLPRASAQVMGVSPGLELGGNGC